MEAAIAAVPSANGTPRFNVVDDTGVAGIPGFFDYAVLYARMVETAPRDAWLIEVGVYHGLSLRHLAHLAKAADRNLTVVGVDWGRGSPEVPPSMAIHPDNVAKLMSCGNLASPMLSTLVTAGVADDCAIILAQSVKAAKFVPDGSCHMVFIDACHTYEAVMADIRAWLPKIASGGFCAGHDYLVFPGVRQAVHDVFGKRDWGARDASSCWEVQL